MTDENKQSQIERCRQHIASLEKKLEESRCYAERYLQVLDRQNSAIHIINRDYKITFLNFYFRDWTRRLGFHLEEEVVGKSVFSVFPFLGDEIRRDYKHVFRSGEDLTSREHVIINSREVIVETQKIPVLHQGKVVEVITIIDDSTAPHQTRRELKDSEARLQALFTYAPIAYYLTDLKGTFIDGNRAAEKLIGAPKSEFIGKNYLATKMLPKSQFPIAAKILAQAVVGKITGPYEVILNRGDGSQVHVEITNIPIKIKGKAQILGMAVDITARKKAEAQEKQFIEKLQKLYQAGMRLGETSSEDDIFLIIATQLQDLCGDCYVAVSDYLEDEDVIEIKVLKGLQKHARQLIRLIGRNPIGMKFTPDTETARKRLQRQQLRKVDEGLYEVTFHKIPLNVCRAISTLLGLKAIYAVTFLWKGVLNGTAVICLKSREELEDIELVENYINQASVTLQRWKTEKAIAESLQEKEVLLREIHHRVKNNMQIISSLLRLQSRGISNESAKAAFKASQARIRTMALVHEGLYRSEDLSHVDFETYVDNLTMHLRSMHMGSPQNIPIHVDIEETHLDINRAIPCGLIINELVSNALKHAFPDTPGGEIHVALTRESRGKLKMVVSDNGIGFPKDIDFRQTDSLGMQLVNDLVRQLNGSMRLKRTRGTEFSILF